MQAFAAVQASVVHLQGVSLAKRFALVPLGPPCLTYSSTSKVSPWTLHPTVSLDSLISYTKCFTSNMLHDCCVGMSMQTILCSIFVHDQSRRSAHRHGMLDWIGFSLFKHTRQIMRDVVSREMSILVYLCLAVTETVSLVVMSTIMKWTFAVVMIQCPSCCSEAKSLHWPI